MRHLLFIIITAFGLLATQQQAAAANKPVRQAAKGQDRSHAIISALPRSTSFAEQVQVARVLVTSTPKRDHRALDDCYFPAQLALYYTCPVHTLITDQQYPHPVQQRLLLLFPQHYFW